jgi:hypothetical protein
MLRLPFGDVWLPKQGGSGMLFHAADDAYVFYVAGIFGALAKRVEASEGDRESGGQ